MTKLHYFRTFFLHFLTKNGFDLLFPKLALYLCAVLDVEPNSKNMLTTRKIARTTSKTDSYDFWFGFVLVMVALVNILNAIAIIW